MTRAGFAVRDITPPAGLAMAGFVARVEPAIGAHDALTVRAVAVDDTAIVVADVIGIDQAMSARIRARCVLPDEHVVVAATHTHGGPVSMQGRLWAEASSDFLQRLEDACVAAIDQAVACQVEAQLTFGSGDDPEVAKNRRHPLGITDSALPVLRVRDRTGNLLGAFVSYACHPVVLGADNLLWTADYPHFVRAEIENAHPGAVAVFATGCTGDANTGHAAHASITRGANPNRTFEAAERIGRKIGRAALAAPERELTGPVAVDNRLCTLLLDRREPQPLFDLEAKWRQDALAANPVDSVLLHCWAEWASRMADAELAPVPSRVTALNWCGVPILALPGEIFASTGVVLRGHWPKGEALILGFADDNPGYIPPSEEYAFGGYEVDEAHRYYGMPAGFKRGSAEVLASAGIELLNSFKRVVFK